METGVLREEEEVGKDGVWILYEEDVRRRRKGRELRSGLDTSKGEAASRAEERLTLLRPG